MHIPVLICGFVCGWKYGLIVGLVVPVLRSLIWGMPVILKALAMVSGRIVWGMVSFMIYSLVGNPFTWEIFLGGALLQAVPGIILQILIIPPIVMVLQKNGFLEK